jgi:hypothetical protein
MNQPTISDSQPDDPTPDELESNVRAVLASLRDMERGEIGQPIDEFAIEFCERNGIDAEHAY